jgi:hypothetical protein
VDHGLEAADLTDAQREEYRQAIRLAPPCRARSCPGERHPWPANSQWRWDKDGVVNYPLKFKRLIVELPEKVLHVKNFAPPPRPEIYLKDLSVGQD